MVTIMDDILNDRPKPCATIETSVESVRRYLESMPVQIPFKEEVRQHGFWRTVMIEFLATLMLIVFGCGATTSRIEPTTKLQIDEQWRKLRFDPIDDLIMSIVLGSVYGIMNAIFGNISGGHLNPVITLVMLINRYISPFKALMYIIAQFLGSIAGSGIIYGLSPHKFLMRDKLPWANIPECNVTSSQAFGAEFFATFLVVIVFLYAYDHRKLSPSTTSGSIFVGIAYLVANLFAKNYSGGSMNPARSFGPALILWIWKDHWVYWVGPIVGSILALFTYEYTRDIIEGQPRLSNNLPSSHSEETSMNNDLRI